VDKESLGGVTYCTINCKGGCRETLVRGGTRIEIKGEEKRIWKSGAWREGKHNALLRRGVSFFRRAPVCKKKRGESNGTGGQKKEGQFDAGDVVARKGVRRIKLKAGQKEKTVKWRREETDSLRGKAKPLLRGAIHIKRREEYGKWLEEDGDILLPKIATEETGTSEISRVPPA